MARDLYDEFGNELPEMLAKVSTCPDHLQEAVLHGMIMAFLTPPYGVVMAETMAESQTQTTDSNGNVQNEPSDTWDYRRDLLRLAKEHNVDLKKLNGQQFSTYVAYIFNMLGPRELHEDGITADIVIDASRTADRRVPGNVSATLSHAKENRLLDKAKVAGRYKLAPKGENVIYDILNDDYGA